MGQLLPVGALAERRLSVDMIYLATPLTAWCIAGCSKFAINSLKAGRAAFALIGYGGLPSTHSAIVSSTVFVIMLREGIGHPAFGAALTLAFITILDAGSLRKQIGQHAKIINRFHRPEGELRERIGHSQLEILAGVLTGALTVWIIHQLFPLSGQS